MYISSVSNSLVKKVTVLKMKTGFGDEFEVILEGKRLVLDAERFGAALSAVLIREGYTGEVPLSKLKYTLKPNVFDKISETVTPQGIMAIAKIKKQSINLDRDNGAVVICDNIRDPGNMGTIIRTVHGAGASGVILTKGCVSPYNSKALRAAMGSTFAVNIELIEDVGELSRLKKAGYNLCCGVLAADSEDIFKTNFKGKFAFAVGNEGSGVSADITALCNRKITIPMPGGAESLNAAVASALMIYEHLRQNTKR